MREDTRGDWEGIGSWCSGNPEGMVQGEDREDTGSFRCSRRAEASVSVLDGAMILMDRLLEKPVLLLFLDLLGQGLHRAKPLRPVTLRSSIHPTARRVPIHHVISSHNVACRISCVPVGGSPESWTPHKDDRTRGRS